MGISPSCNQHAAVACYAWAPPDAILTPHLYLAVDNVFMRHVQRQAHTKYAGLT